MPAATAFGTFLDFKHTPLDLTKDQIRLLRIKSLANDPELVMCTTETFDCNKTSLPQYNALSYVWGSAPSKYGILMNRQIFAIRENLWQFLTDYAAGMWDIQVEYWWIDQLCIDQETIREKNHQVKLMSKIYKNAFQVVSWLGRKNAGSDSFTGPDDLSFSAFRPGIFSNEYWTRLWVVQEIMLAERWILLHGRTIYREEELFPQIGQVRDVMLSWVDYPPSVLWVRQRKILDFRNEPPLLITSLMNFAHLQSAQSQDKIYALLGLAADGAKFTVDYDLAPTAVFWAAMNAIDDDSIIDPSGIVRLAFDMGMIKENRIIKSDRFSYMPMQEIKFALERRELIRCAPNVLDPIEAQQLILDAERKRVPPAVSEASGNQKVSEPPCCVLM